MICIQSIIVPVSYLSEMDKTNFGSLSPHKIQVNLNMLLSSICHHTDSTKSRMLTGKEYRKFGVRMGL
jgi:hypothetical protein